jgi:hypothetical protein
MVVIIILLSWSVHIMCTSHLLHPRIIKTLNGFQQQSKRGETKQGTYLRERAFKTHVILSTGYGNRLSRRKHYQHLLLLKYKIKLMPFTRSHKPRLFRPALCSVSRTRCRSILWIPLSLKGLNLCGGAVYSLGIMMK